MRVFLFQLLSVIGKWEDALTQLNVAAELDSKHLLVANMYRPALISEAFRSEVFCGNRLPLVFGEPSEWVGWLIQANQLCGKGQYEAAKSLRNQAFDAAPMIPGVIDGHPFEWVADADDRLGPMFEAVIDGKYYWLPVTALRCIYLEPPGALSDAVWASAHFTWVNQGESFGLIPTRYPDSENREDSLRLSRRTEWFEMASEYYGGLGQRILTTDKEEYPLLEVRRIEFDAGQAT